MGCLRSVIESIEQVLQANNYSRATELFTVERMGQASHRIYTFGIFTIVPGYYDSNRVAFGDGTGIEFLIAWKARGSHNASGQIQEALLDLADEYEMLEDLIIRNQVHPNKEDLSFGTSVIQPLRTEDEQEMLILSIIILFDVNRE